MHMHTYMNTICTRGLHTGAGADDDAVPAHTHTKIHANIHTRINAHVYTYEHSLHLRGRHRSRHRSRLSCDHARYLAYIQSLGQVLRGWRSQSQGLRTLRLSLRRACSTWDFVLRGQAAAGTWGTRRCRGFPRNIAGISGNFAGDLGQFGCLGYWLVWCAYVENAGAVVGCALCWVLGLYVCVNVCVSVCNHSFICNLASRMKSRDTHRTQTDRQLRFQNNVVTCKSHIATVSSFNNSIGHFVFKCNKEDYLSLS
jgi:hypothetical protein